MITLCPSCFSLLINCYWPPSSIITQIYSPSLFITAHYHSFIIFYSPLLLTDGCSFLASKQDRSSTPNIAKVAHSPSWLAITYKRSPFHSITLFLSVALLADCCLIWPIVLMHCWPSSVVFFTYCCYHHTPLSPFHLLSLIFCRLEWIIRKMSDFQKYETVDQL